MSKEKFNKNTSKLKSKVLPVNDPYYCESCGYIDKPFRAIGSLFLIISLTLFVILFLILPNFILALIPPFFIIFFGYYREPLRCRKCESSKIRLSDWDDVKNSATNLLENNKTK